ncbi:sulfatase [Puteibacter caeruleilacunae]|nr:sulfatase [Puteibacter caeruleilacunae]
MNEKNLNRRSFIRNTAMAGTGMMMMPSFLKAMEGFKDGERPNLLLIFADQFRKSSMSFLKEDPVYTPNIDKLAKDGVYFSNAVSNHPLCSPYRAMLMSGKYPLKNGVIANCHSGRTVHGNYLKKKDVCFSDVLATNGYSAGYVGKWHLDGPEPTKPGTPNIWDSFCPQDRRHGFDFWHAYGTHNRHLKPYYWSTNAKEDEKKVYNQWSPEHEADVINNYINNTNGSYRKDDEPFALFWGINPPHTPFSEVPEKYRKRYKGKSHEDLLKRPNVSFKENNDIKVGDHGVEKKIHQAPDYFACVDGVDEQIGRVIDTLKEKGLYDNTIIVFSADHGEMLGSQGLMHKNIWFREAYDIPFIVHWPKKIKPKQEDLLISVPDYMPTILSLMGLQNDIPTDLEGIDYSDVFFNKKVDRPDCQLYFGSEPSAPWTGKRGIRTDRYTFAVVKNEDASKTYYLYDDVDDYYQTKNIWGKNPKEDKKLKKKLWKLLKEMNDPWIERDV